MASPPMRCTHGHALQLGTPGLTPSQRMALHAPYMDACNPPWGYPPLLSILLFSALALFLNVNVGCVLRPLTGTTTLEPKSSATCSGPRQ